MRPEVKAAVQSSSALVRKTMKEETAQKLSKRSAKQPAADASPASDKPVNKLFTLLGDPTFYVKYSALQLLGVLLHNRRQAVQGYFLKAQNAPGHVLAALEDREILRNGALQC